MAAWSQLPGDLCSLIGERLDTVSDRCRFRSVCNSWRRSLPPFAQPPLLMLSEPSQYKTREEADEDKVTVNTPPLRGFVGIGGGEPEQQVVYEIDFPEAHQHRCLGSKGNWLITVDKSGMIHLLNPFSRLRFLLPPQSSFEDNVAEVDKTLTPVIRRDYFLHKTVMSSTPSTSSKDCIVMAIHSSKLKLAIARPGDATWTTVEIPAKRVQDIIFFKDQFYAVTHFGVVVVCDIGDGISPPKASVLVEKMSKAHLREVKYLVELSGQLLLVIKNIALPPKTKVYKTVNFEVYKLDFTNKEWEDVNSLGDYCLFLGHNNSVSIPTMNYSGLQKNCIYFTDDFALGYRGREIRGGRDMGVFNLDDKSIRPHYKGESTCFYSPPVWLVPSPVKLIHDRLPITVKG